MEAPIGFEPMHKGFAVRRVGSPTFYLFFIFNYLQDGLALISSHLLIEK